MAYSLFNFTIPDTINMLSTNSQEILPLLAVSDIVIFVHIEQTLIVNRPRSIAAIEQALSSEEKTLVVSTKRNLNEEKTSLEDLYHVGTKVAISQMQRLPNNFLSITLQGLERVMIKDIDDTLPYQQAKFEIIPLPTDQSNETEAMHREILEQVSQIDTLISNNWPKGLLTKMLHQFKDPLDQVFSLCSLLHLSIEQQQSILEVKTRLEALSLLHDFLNNELQVLKLQQDIAKQAAGNISEEQRKYMLRRQLEEIQKELGEENPEQAEIDMLEGKIDDADLPEETKQTALKELERLKKTSPQAHDHRIIREYLELIIELPWNKLTEDNLDLVHARKVLDEDHFGLKEIKERIVEHLAIYKRNPRAKSPILCFVGPPGVGKTSMGESMANALGRKFERISLGGLHDEAELRGHRKTYIGAMPGRIIQAIQRTGTKNPLIMLDEVDKLGRDYRGDPSAALMEILDPSQNINFRDNYLELPFDLSNVFFLATANTLDTIPRPLLDRMEVLRLSGYTEEEKIQIAKKYLIPQQLHEINLSSSEIVIPDEVVGKIIRRYTREAGVRELSRQLAKTIRKALTILVDNNESKVTLNEAMLTELLGRERFFIEEMRHTLAPGITPGLAWTESGGDVLYVESALIPKGSGLLLTGQLGEVMKESAQTAQSYILSNAELLGIAIEQLRESSVHIHVPAGAIPKDGPSAGVTIATSLFSLFTQKAVRSDTAMTGEITLAGLVLPVGGIKEKVLAARRSGIKRIILPASNMADLEDIDKKIREEIEFLPVTQLNEVFKSAVT